MGNTIKLMNDINVSINIQVVLLYQFVKYCLQGKMGQVSTRSLCIISHKLPVTLQLPQYFNNDNSNKKMALCDPVPCITCEQDPVTCF